MAGIEAGWGLDVILWFQSWRTPFTETLGVVFAALGSEDFYILMLPLIYWCIDAPAGRRISVFFLLGIWLNSAVKMGLQRPRPYMISSQVRTPARMDDGSYGLPSGHAQGTTMLWGAIAAGVRKRWLTLAVVVYIILMSLSRIVLGVHYPQDVIAGVLLGAALLALYVWLEPPFSRWMSRQTLFIQIGVVVAVSAALLIIHPGLIPVAYSPALEVPPTLDELFSWSVTPAAAILGAGIGWVLEVRYLSYDASGRLWQRALRYMIGFAGLAVLRFGLGALFDGLDPAFIFRLIRYTLIGLWIGLGAPWLFIQLKLAHPIPQAP